MLWLIPFQHDGCSEPKIETSSRFWWKEIPEIKNVNPKLFQRNEH